MLVVVEGVDGVGKSTLTRMLAEYVRERYRHDDVDVRSCGPPKRHVLEEYVLDVEDYLCVPGTSRIYDRLHLGELVYGPIYRAKSQLDGTMRRYVELVLQARGAVLVVVHPGASWRARLDRGEVYVNYGTGESQMAAERALLAAQQYRVLARTAGAVTTLELTGHATSGVVTGIAHAAEDARGRVWRNVQGRFATLVGNPTALCEYLLVGDARGPRNGAGFQSCFVPFPATSGHYLMRAIPEELDGRYAIVNANDGDDVPALWQALGEPHVVALGVNARRKLDAFGIPRGAVPHPQFRRRFHNADVAVYGEMIFKCAETGDTWQLS